MSRIRNVRGFVSVLFLALAVVFSAGNVPARADIIDDIGKKAKECVDAAYEVADAYGTAISKAPGIAACVGMLGSSNAAGIAITGLISGLYLAGKFDNEAQCNGLITSAIAFALGELLDAAPGVKSGMVDFLNFLGLDGEAIVAAFITAAAEEATTALSNTPGVSTVFGYVTCGCTIVGGIAEIKDEMVQAGKSAGECLGPLGDAIGWLEDALGWVYDNTLGSLQAKPVKGPHYKMDPNSVCPVGIMWNGGWDVYTKAYAELHAGEEVYPDWGASNFKANSMCACPTGFLPVFKQDGNSVLQGCGCPEGEKLASQGGKDVCVPACGYGTKYSFASHACEPICKQGVYEGKTASGNPLCTYKCDDPKAVYSWSQNTCTVCTGNMVAVHTPKNGNDSTGYCSACGWDEKADSNSCKDICPDKWTKYDAKYFAGPTCVAKCGPGQRYVEVNSGPEVGEQPFTCEPCGEGLQLDYATNTCVPCAKGAVWSDKVGFANAGPGCTCPGATVPIDGVCSSCPEGSRLAISDGGAYSCVACENNACDPFNRQRIECHNANGIFSEKLRQCIPCGKDATAYGSICVPNKPHRAGETPRVAQLPPQALPPGTVELAPCPAGEVREATTGLCKACEDGSRAVGGRCVPLRLGKPGDGAEPDMPASDYKVWQASLPACGDGQVRDPVTLKCVSCGAGAYASGGRCFGTERSAGKLGGAEGMRKGRKVVVRNERGPCDPGTYANGTFCVQEVLPDWDDAVRRCGPVGRNFVIDGKAGGGCVACPAGTTANRDRLACSGAGRKAASLRETPAPRIKDQPTIRKRAVEPKKAVQATQGEKTRPAAEPRPRRSLAPDLDFDGGGGGSRGPAGGGGGGNRGSGATIVAPSGAGRVR